MNDLAFRVLSAELVKNTNSDAYKEVISKNVKKIEDVAYWYYTTEDHQYLNNYWHKQVKQKDDVKKRIEKITDDALNEVLNIIQGDQLDYMHSSSLNGELILQSVMKRLPQNIDSFFASNSQRIKQAQQNLKRIHEQEREHRQKYQSIKRKNQQRKLQLAKRQQQMLKKMQEQKRKKIRQLSLQKIKEHQKAEEQRKNQHEKFKQFYKQYKSSKPLHVLMEQEYREKIFLPEIEERNKKLAEKKVIAKPSLQQINAHQQQYLQSKKNKPQKSVIMHQTIDVGYKSRFYLDQQRKYFGESENEAQTIYDFYEKKKRYSQFVKEKFKPKLRQQQQSEEDQKPQNSKVNGHQYLQVPDRSRYIEVGNKYLQFVKGLEKKRNLHSSQSISNSRETNIKTSRYTNYLEDMKKMHNSLHKGVGSNWERDLKDKTVSTFQRRDRVLIKSKQLQQRAYRKQQFLSLYNHAKANDILQQKNEIDDTLIQSIRAKMAVLKESKQ